MNKIERAIYDTKLYIKEAERKILIANTELNSLKEQLKTLELIQNDHTIKN